MDHAKYSPSSLENLENCPCFEQSTSKDNLAAEEGHRIHEAIAANDLNLCDDEFEQAIAERCIKYRKTLISELPDPILKIASELRLDIAGLTRGIVDLLVLTEKYAVLVDWKTGKFPVPPANENIQLQAYSLGVLHTHSHIQSVKVHIICPKLDFISTACYTREDMPSITSRIMNVIVRREDPARQPTLHEDACRFCAVKAECPKMTELVQHTALGINLPVEFNPNAILTPEDRQKAQVLSHLMEDWATQIRKSNTKAAENGEKIPGFSLRSRAGNKTIIDTEAVITHIATKYGVSETDILSCCKASIPKLIDAVRKQTGETKKETREKILIEIDEYVTQNETVTYLQRDPKQDGKILTT